LLWGPPYPLFLIAYIFNGFGLGLQVRLGYADASAVSDGQDAQVNSITSRLPNANTKMFLLHAFYGLGATISPLVATEFVKREPNRVYLYFAVSLGLGITTVVALLSVFQLRTEDQVVGKREPAARPAETEASNDKDVTAASEPLDEVEKEEEEGSGNKLKRIWKTPAVHFMAFYLAIYVSSWVARIRLRC
jgi:MFS family permease